MNQDRVRFLLRELLSACEVSQNLAATAIRMFTGNGEFSQSTISRFLAGHAVSEENFTSLTSLAVSLQLSKSLNRLPADLTLKSKLSVIGYSLRAA